MAGPRYIADPPELVRRVELEGLTAIFHRPSGMTHILAPPAPQILEALADRPFDLDDLADHLGGRFEVEGDRAALAARLAELESTGLVRRA